MSKWGERITDPRHVGDMGHIVQNKVGVIEEKDAGSIEGSFPESLRGM